MAKVASSEDVSGLGLLASAIARRALRVAATEPGEAAWTDGQVVYLDTARSTREQIDTLSVQASLLAAGSLEGEIVRALAHRPALARRYLAVEGHRALGALELILPPSARSLIRPDVAAASYSPSSSLSAARRGTGVVAPASFGTIRPRRILSSLRLRNVEKSQAEHLARARARRGLPELVDDPTAEDGAADSFSSPVGGGGAIGRWLAKLLAPVRRLGGGGAPGADAPTHSTRDGRRAPGRPASWTVRAESLTESAVDQHGRGTQYPEWDEPGRRYREGWCTVHEAEVDANAEMRFAVPDRRKLCRSLARVGLGVGRYPRQTQGDDIDIDAAIEARVEALAGSAPEEAIFVDSVRRRRNLAVLVLLDVSGSAAELAGRGKTVHDEQRAAATATMLALHELGARVALYAYQSQGRSAVRVMPVKRFDEDPGALVLQRLGGLVPGAYSRLGAAIRHGTAVLRRDAGVPQQVLVVLSDGLAYDHGYEPSYGAADARRSLGEARRQGVGCLCLSVGASTDTETLGRVFGASAHAMLPTPEHLSHVLGPLLHSALRSADIRRRGRKGGPR